MYEKYWKSDDEQDAVDLSEIVHDNFIDNLKKGGQMPLVLPAKDEKQFFRLLTKKAQENEMDIDLPSTSVKSNEFIKTIKVEPDRETSNFDLKNLKVENVFFNSNNDNSNSYSPTLQKLKNAGETIKNLINKNDASLMLFQMPSSLKPLDFVDSQQKQQQQQQNTPVSIQPKKNKADITSTSNLSNNSTHILSNLPTGVEVGKLQILRSGRVIINIGGNCMDVLEAIPSKCFETAVCIETQKNTEINNINNSRSIFNHRNSLSEKDNSKNSFEILGNIPYSFVCAYDLKSTKNRRLQKMSLEADIKR